MAKKIGFLIGSLRKDSWNRKVAQAVKTLFPAEYEVSLIEISDLPFYTEAFDQEGAPAEVEAFRKEIAAQDAFVFFTPEYNRTFTAPLKNALDAASRPYGQNQWDGKPAAILSASPGSSGGMAANLALRAPFVFLNMPLLQQPEIYLSHIAQSFEEDGKTLVPRTEAFLKKFVDAYLTFIARF